MTHLRLQALPFLFALAAGCAGDDTSSDGGSDTDADGTDSDTGANPTTRGDGSGDSSDTDDDGSGTAGTACSATAAHWSASNWDTNAAEALALRAQLDTLTGDATMRGAETGAMTLAGVRDLQAVWAGDPSLADAANPGYVPVVEAMFAEFIEVLEAGPQDLLDMSGWDPGPAGGLWGDDARGINEGGLEVRQLVDKGGYSAGVLYHYALTLTEGEIDAATIDAIAAAWGSNADLDGAGELTDSANYSYQMGYFGSMADRLATAKVSAADPACAAERDAALVEFFALWEETAVSRTIFYGRRAEGKLLAAATPTEFADVLHDLGEGIGMTAGFHDLPDPAAGPLAGAGRIMSQADVDAIMAAYGVDLSTPEASTTGLFLESLPDLEAATDEATAVAMSAFGVDAATVAGWAMPTPG